MMMMCFFFIFNIKASVVGTHLKCDKSLQFKWVLTTYAFIMAVINRLRNCLTVRLQG